MSETWFWADTHLGHANIMKYCNRPFQSVEEMDEILVARWNERVSNKDKIYFLGDFMFTRRKGDPDAMLDRLNGQKFLIIGNHDSKPTKNAKGWNATYRLQKVVVDNQTIILCHYPMFSWQGSCHGSWMLHGHCHGTLQTSSNYSGIDFDRLLLKDVGVDVCPNPLSFGEIRSEMNAKESNLAI